MHCINNTAKIGKVINLFHYLVIEHTLRISGDSKAVITLWMGPPLFGITWTCLPIGHNQIAAICCRCFLLSCLP